MSNYAIVITVLSLLGVIGAGCGGTSYSSQFTCNVPATALCEEYKTNIDADAAELRDSCSQNGGQVTLDPCPTAKLLGKCSKSDKDSEVTIFIYPSSTVSTVEGAKAGCDNLKGSFSKP